MTMLTATLLKLPIAMLLTCSTSAWAAPVRALAADTGPPLVATKWAAVGFAVLAVLLATLLYALPTRAAAATKRQLELALGERALTLQEEDRRRIARELHDGAGQALTAARLQLMALREGVAAGPRATIGAIVGFVDEAIDEVRRSTTALTPPALAELGLVGAIVRHCETFTAGARLKINRELPTELPSLPSYVETTIYRSVQEALHNAARHGGATQAWVRLAVDGGQLRLEVGDDGAGIRDQAKRGFGLSSMRERAQVAGGVLAVVDDAGPGTRIRVTLPFEELPS